MSESPIIKERTFWNRLRKRLGDRRRRAVAQGAARMVPRPLGIGIIGTGNVVKWAYVPRLLRRGQYRTVAVYDVNRASAERMAEALGGARVCETMLDVVRDDAIDAVLVCTPAPFHHEAVVAAARAGKHVLCEKPLGTSLPEARRMLAAATEAGIVHMVNLSYRFRADVNHAADLIRGGVLGTVYHALGTLSQGEWFDETGQPSRARSDATDWRFGSSGGVLLDLGPHVVDVCRMLLGEVDTVQAWARSFRPGPHVSEDASGLSLGLRNGAVAHLLTSRWATGHKERTHLEVSGSKGALVLEGGGLRLWTRDQPRWRELLLPPAGPDFLSAFRSAAIDGQRAPGFPDFEAGYKNNEVLQAAKISAESCRAVRLPLMDQAPAVAEAPARDVERVGTGKARGMSAPGNGMLYREQYLENAPDGR